MLVQVRLGVFMILSGSIVKIVDNTGAKVAKCIKVLTKNNKASTGDFIIVSLKKVRPRYVPKGQKKEQVKKGEIRIVFVTQSNDFIYRSDGTVVKIFNNQGILVGTKNIINKALGTSFNKPLPYEVKEKAKKWDEVIKMSPQLL